MVAAVIGGVCPGDFKEVARDGECRDLQADPDGGFALSKDMSERYEIIEERSRQRKDRSDKETDTNSFGPHHGAGVHIGTGQGLPNGGERRTPQVLKCRRDIDGESAFRILRWENRDEPN